MEINITAAMKSHIRPVAMVSSYLDLQKLTPTISNLPSISIEETGHCTKIQIKNLASIFSSCSLFHKLVYSLIGVFNFQPFHLEILLASTSKIA